MNIDMTGPLSGLAEEQVSFFKKLHMYPELSHQEYETTRAIREVLLREGIEVLDLPPETGLIARVRGALEGGVVGMRADMDALPVTEETGLEYASRREGIMHACGHDAHTAIALYAAILLNGRRNSLRGDVKVIFQPAEEVSDGAARMMKTGLLSDCGCFLAAHTYPGFPAGVIGIKEGPVMAAADRISLTITGKSAHAAQPHKGVDPIPAMAAFIQAAQTVVSRMTDPFAPALVSITHAQAGNTWNIMPETAFVEGTVRTLDPRDREKAASALKAMAEGICASFGAEADFRFERGAGAVINDAGLCALARDTARELGIACARQEDTMIAEDFSEYLTDKPGLFVRVGTGGDYPLHHPRFTVDTRALFPASLFMARLTETILNQG